MFWHLYFYPRHTGQRRQSNFLREGLHLHSPSSKGAAFLIHFREVNGLIKKDSGNFEIPAKDNFRPRFTLHFYHPRHRISERETGHALASRLWSIARRTSVSNGLEKFQMQRVTILLARRGNNDKDLPAGTLSAYTRRVRRVFHHFPSSSIIPVISRQRKAYMRGCIRNVSYKSITANTVSNAAEFPTNEIRRVNIRGD